MAPLCTPFTTSPSRLSTVRAFLEAHQATAAFLLYTHALERQEGVEIHGARDQVRTRFAMNQWRWYGAFRGTELLAVVCRDMTVGAIGHVGGLYVQPAKRRQGLGRAVMLALMRQTHSDPRLDQLVLFTREDNEPARQLFEQLGFQSTGRFGFLLGAWEEQQDAGGAG